MNLICLKTACQVNSFPHPLLFPILDILSGSFVYISIVICGCLKCSFSSSGSFGFCQTFELFAGWFLISYDRVKYLKAVFMFNF